MSPRRSVWVLTFLSVSILTVQPVFAQGRGGGTGTTGSTGGSTGGTGAGATTGTGTVSRTPGTTGNTPGSTTGTQTQRPQQIFLTGRVLTEDGTPPPETATIERICGGSARAEGYTDSKGYFSIQLGNEQGVFQDASETGSYRMSGLGSSAAGSSDGIGATRGMAADRYAMCDLRAHLPGYRSQLISLANRRPLDDPNIGVILIHREGQDQGSTISAVSLSAPHDAKRAFEHGLQAMKKNKTEEAQKDFEKAVSVFPNYSAAWNELGRIQMGRGDNETARQSFARAIQADPKYVNPYLQLSLIALHDANWKDLADTTAQALKLDPFDYPQAFLFNGVANWNLKNIDAAEKSVRQAEKLDTQHSLPQVSHLMGLILMQRHDFTGAAEHFRTYLKLAPNAEDVAKVRTQLAQAEKLVAQTQVKQDQ